MLRNKFRKHHLALGFPYGILAPPPYGLLPPPKGSQHPPAYRLWDPLPPNGYHSPPSRKRVNGHVVDACSLSEFDENLESFLF